MAGSILIVEDEAEIGSVLSEYLKADGFSTVINSTLEEALATLNRGRPDLLLLDVTLPDGSGLDILRRVRDRDIPVILVTGRREEIDRIMGLEIGADDYVTKPFSPREVVARVRAVLRRARGSSDAGGSHGEVLRFGDLEIDIDAHEVRIANKPAPLTPSEFRLLEVLAHNAGTALTRSQLLDKLSDDGSVFERTLDRHINNLRRKIEPDVQNPSYVVTVYGVGYKFRKL